MTNKTISIFACFIIVIAACLLLDNKKEYINLNDSFWGRRDSNKVQIVVLYDSCYYSPEEYYSELLNHNFSAKYRKFISFIDVSVDSNKIYIQAVKPEVLPVTLVSLGDCIYDIIPGSAYESFEYILYSVLHKESCEFHYNQNYGAKKDSILSNIRDNIALLKDCSSSFSSTDIKAEDADPFVLAFAMRMAIMRNDSLEMRRCAEIFLQCKDPCMPFLFEREMQAAYNILYNNHSNGPRLKVDCINKSASNKEMRNQYQLTNIGDSDLHIFDIIKSCSCIESSIDYGYFVIRPFENKIISVSFPKESSSSLFLFVVSDSHNDKMHKIKLNDSLF